MTGLKIPRHSLARPAACSARPINAHGRPAAGHAALSVDIVGRQSTVTSSVASSPLKLLIPRARGESAWVYLSSLGGGLLAGDQNRLDVTLGEGAKCFLGTQASTKIYRNPLARPCAQRTRATVGANALLVMAPDAVQPFADSDYVQQQEFHLGNGAGLVLVDWFTSGRKESGECWAFRRYRSRNEIFIDGRCRVLDSLLLEQADGPSGLQQRMGRYHCFASLLMIGPSLAAPAEALLGAIAATELSRRAPLLVSASPVVGGALLRIAGETAEMVRHELHRRLGFLKAFLGDDPWSRKW